MALNTSLGPLSRRDLLLSTAAAGVGAGLIAHGPASATPKAAAIPLATQGRRRSVSYCPVDPRDGRDVTAELTTWLQSLPPRTTADLRGRIYRSETAIRLVDKSRLTIQNGTLLRTVVGSLVWPKPNPHLWLLRPNRCTVKDLHIRGTNTMPDQRPGFGAYKRDYEFEAAVRLEQFTDCRVKNMTVDAVWGDGVQWQVGSGARMADCLIDRNGRQGVTTIGSNMLIERVRIEHSRRSGFDLEPDTAGQGVENIEIRDCYTNTIGLAFASAGRGAVDHVYLHHNTSAGPSVPVLHVRASDGARRADWRFEDHVALGGLGSPAEAVRMVNVDGFSIKRNRIPVASSQSRLTLGASGCGGACTVKDNDFGDGIYYFNRSPLQSQILSLGSNTPVLSKMA